MKILRWLGITFSLFSRIPVPRFKWREEEMRYSMAFLPLVGGIIGLGTYLISGVNPFAELPVAVRILLTLALSLLIT